MEFFFLLHFVHFGCISARLSSIARSFIFMYLALIMRSKNTEKNVFFFFFSLCIFRFRFGCVCPSVCVFVCACLHFRCTSKSVWNNEQFFAIVLIFIIFCFGFGEMSRRWWERWWLKWQCQRHDILNLLFWATERRRSIKPLNCRKRVYVCVCTLELHTYVFLCMRKTTHEKYIYAGSLAFRSVLFLSCRFSFRLWQNQHKSSCLRFGFWSSLCRVCRQRRATTNRLAKIKFISANAKAKVENISHMFSVNQQWLQKVGRKHKRTREMA